MSRLTKASQTFKYMYLMSSPYLGSGAAGRQINAINSKCIDHEVSYRLQRKYPAGCSLWDYGCDVGGRASITTEHPGGYYGFNTMAAEV